MTPPFVRPGENCIELCLVDGRVPGQLITRKLRADTALRLAERLLHEANRLLGDQMLPRNQTGD